jgi:sulfite reductase subunit B
MKVMSKGDFLAFVDVLIEDENLDVEGVKAKGDKFVFGPLDSAKELRLDYDVTILPPKKYFLPQYETIVEFDLSHPFEARRPEHPETKKVLVGVHPYDIIAIQQMDSYFLDTDITELFFRRRKNTLIIGLDVNNVAEKAFFGDMGTGQVDAGFDLFITDLGDRVAIEIGSIEGERLLHHVQNLEDSMPSDVQRVQEIRDTAAAKASRDLKVKPKGWHDLLDKNYESPVWKENSDKCLACGTCTMVCPTCFCYDVQDDLQLDLKTGERRRTWDGCLLREFTVVASGEVFREDIEDRYRHRFHRKGRYLPDRLGFVACVGCGRCSSQCLPDIADPVNLINKLAESTEEIEEREADTRTMKTRFEDVAAKSPKPLHMPQPATIRRAERMTDKESLFEIELDSGEPLNHKPGQFVELSLFGTGEAPISVSSAPGGTSFEIVVRKVGDVTSKLHLMSPGDKVGIRGPFGNGFDVDALKGKDLLFIAGGLGVVPMRSLFNHVLNNRQDFGEVMILYGCKEPCELLFNTEVSAWGQRDDITHMLTVDTCPEGECWEGNIGVITTLLPKVQFDPKKTMAIVIGPPIMYRFVNRDLLNLGMPEENIIVSLERRMKCGVGKCGHCQMNGVYVCKDGPVFNYKDIKDLPEAFT